MDIERNRVTKCNVIRKAVWPHLHRLSVGRYPIILEYNPMQEHPPFEEMHCGDYNYLSVGNENPMDDRRIVKMQSAKISCLCKGDGN